MKKSVNNIDKVIKSLQVANTTALHLLGKFLVDEMKKRVPIDTGNLKNKCNYKVEKNKLYLTNDAEYAGYVEFGTYKMQAQPFMQPAVFDNLHKIQEILKKGYKDAGLD